MNYYIIGHRLLSSDSRVSSNVKPQTSLMNDLLKVSGFGRNPGRIVHLHRWDSGLDYKDLRNVV